MNDPPPILLAYSDLRKILTSLAEDRNQSDESTSDDDCQFGTSSSDCSSEEFNCHTVGAGGVLDTFVFEISSEVDQMGLDLNKQAGEQVRPLVLMESTSRPTMTSTRANLCYLRLRRWNLVVPVWTWTILDQLKRGL